MTVQEALQNVAIVTSNAKMTGQEHDALRESIKLLVQRCNVADALEREKDGRTDKQPELSGVDQEGSE